MQSALSLLSQGLFKVVSHWVGIVEDLIETQNAGNYTRCSLEIPLNGTFT